MKKFFAVVFAAALLFIFAACSRFGPHDNPPMTVLSAFNLNIR